MTGLIIVKLDTPVKLEKACQPNSKTTQEHSTKRKVICIQAMSVTTLGLSKLIFTVIIKVIAFTTPEYSVRNENKELSFGISPG